ncbi:hypothetical protein PIB30_065405 [Stylosanthes scabra]|uniref:Uncharacterized protein n=2 Tax=Stylosanthes scabra TaxID=79078 RepID=A0ABU6WKD7_9FABA|nr:hypothetical protein [Stylosanthes scabra]
MELPECPVCLERYDDQFSIPRVLSCGHSVCEACLVELPLRFPNTIRCPACTQLVKYSSEQGPSSLPKNIDLLRVCLSSSSSSSRSVKPSQRSTIEGCDDRSVIRDRLWSDEFYAKWKEWIIPHDAVLVESRPEPEPSGFLLRGRFGSNSSLKGRVSVCSRNSKCLSLVPVFPLPRVVNCSKFNFSYVARIMECLEGIKEVEREELALILEASMRQGRVSRVYGLWSEAEVVDGVLYLVCERHNGGSILEKFGELKYGFLGLGLEDKKDGIFSFAVTGKSVCDSVLALHLEGLVAGCLGLSCFVFDELGGVCVDLNEVLVMGRKIVYGFSGGNKDKQKEEGLFKGCLKNELFLSPEVLFRLLQKNVAVNPEGEHSRYPFGYGSDVWSLACVLLRLLIGDALPQIPFEMSEQNGFDLSASYACWAKNVSSVLEDKLGSEYSSLRGTLCKCLDIDPGNRASLMDLRRCIQDILVKPEFDFLGNLEVTDNQNSTGCCLVLGEFCQFPKGSSKGQGEYEVNEKEHDGLTDVVQDGEDKPAADLVASLSKGMTELKDLRGHMDCISGLAIGGGYLFSSSFDKTVKVWSSQDFSLLHTFKGHENKVMALVYVDDEEPLCVSGDNGGGIFVWGLTAPLRQDPLRKWYEQKDWRFSGIHSLTVSASRCLYTGSGDRTIKGWSLKDGTLMCTMNGHKSVVSTLVVCDEVLYSGSWDGTVRLWSLSDHSPLTVLGEDMPGEMKSVLAITVDRHLLVAAHENGCIKAWRNDVFVSSKSLHNGAIFAMSMQGQCLYTGGWDKKVNIQELAGDELELDVRAFGTISCSSVVTAILSFQGKLFVGYADKSIKVYRGKW